MGSRQSARRSLGPDLASVRAARAFVGEIIQSWNLGSLLDDALSVVSELASNAVLHASTPFEVLVARSGPGIRIAVHDRSSRPVRPPHGLPDEEPGGILDEEDSLQALERLLEQTAATGRGLRMVAGLADAWGIDTTAGGAEGKTVWAAVGTGTAAEVAELPGERPRPAASSARPVRMIAMPVRLALAGQLQIDALQREAALLAGAPPAGAPAAMLAALADLARLAVEPDSRQGARRDAVRHALQRGDRLFDLSMLMTAEDARALRHLGEVADDLTVPTRLGLLLSPPVEDEVLAYRAWYIAEVERQIGGSPPRACPFPVLPAKHATTAAAGSRADMRHRLIDELAQEMAGAATTRSLTAILVGRAARALGASSAAVCLLGDDNETVEVADSFGYDQQVEMRWERFPLSADTPASEAVRTGQPVVLRTMAERDMRYPVFAETPAHDDATSVSMPMTHGGSTSGVWVVGFRNARDFSGAGLAVVEAVAGAAAVRLQTLAGARRAADTRRAEDLMAELQPLLARVPADHDKAVALVRQVVAAAPPRLADWCAIHLVDGAGQPGFIAAAHVDPAKAALARELYTRWPGAEENVGMMLCVHTGNAARYQAMSPAVLEASIHDPGQLRVLIDLDFGSAAIIPITHGGQLFGVMSLANERGRFVGDIHYALSRRLGEQLGAALAGVVPGLVPEG